MDWILTEWQSSYYELLRQPDNVIKVVSDILKKLFYFEIKNQKDSYTLRFVFLIPY